MRLLHKLSEPLVLQQNLLRPIEPIGRHPKPCDKQGNTLMLATTLKKDTWLKTSSSQQKRQPLKRV